MFIAGMALLSLMAVYGAWQIVSGLMEEVAEKPYATTKTALIKPFDTSLLKSDLFNALVLYGPAKVEGLPDGNPAPFAKVK